MAFWPSLRPKVSGMTYMIGHYYLGFFLLFFSTFLFGFGRAGRYVPKKKGKKRKKKNNAMKVNIPPLGTYHISKAKIPQALLLNGGQENRVKRIAGIVPHGQQNLHHRFIVLHVQLDGTAGKRPFGALLAHGVLAATWKGDEFFIVKAASGRVLEGEMRGDEEREREGGDGDGGEFWEHSLFFLFCLFASIF